MARNLPPSPLLHRDGTSQAARLQEALDPGYVAVDERTVEDLLAFAQEYGKELKYYGADNRKAGDWSAFIDPSLELADVAAFMEDPEKVAPQGTEGGAYRRPHFVLFLTFLRLLRQAQGELNTLTRRHLDFYYRQVLRMNGKPAIPDRVNVLVDLAADVGHALLPAGTGLAAGPDSLGQERLYATERDAVVSRAQVARLSSVHVERRITGLREAREAHRNDRPRRCLAMLEVALGDPLPGDPLPLYPEAGGGAGKVVGFDLLTGLEALLDFAHSHLHMEFFELRDLMKWKDRREGRQAEEDWAEINRLLEKAGRTREEDFALGPEDPRDFAANLDKAVGGLPSFDGLPEVESVDDLYDHRIRQEVKQLVTEKLFFEDFNDFVELMQIKVRIDNEWREIHRLLEQAGLERDPDFRMGDCPPADFAACFESAVGADFSDLPGVANLDEYHAAILRLEEYFFLSAEELAYFMSVADKDGTSAREWEKVDRILVKAHREKVYAARRERLKAVRESQGFSAMVRHVLGEEATAAEDSTALERLRPFLGAAELEPPADGASPQEWEGVYRTAEIAQRNREGLPEPVPRKEEWLNLYPAEEASAVGVELGIEGEQTRWKTFGRPQAAAGPEAPPVIGWAVGSPLLALSEGERKITLTLGFSPDGFDGEALSELLQGNLLDEESPLRFEVSTEKGWAEPRSAAAEVSASPAVGEDLPAIRFSLRFAEDADAIALLADPVESERAYGDRWPVLRLMLRQVRDPESGRLRTLYPPFRPLRLVSVHLAVEVSGLATIQLQNDDGALDAKKPFEPFGSDPATGSRLFLGHPELITKPLDQLAFRVEWMGLPDDLAAHYRNYGLGPDPAFTTRISLVDRREEKALEKRAGLFPDAAAGEHRIEISDVPAYDRAPAAAEGEDLLAWDRYLLWELGEPDFQHRTYPSVATGKSIEMAAAIANRTDGGTIDAAAYQVNPPYTPRIRSLKVDYSSSSEIRLDGPGPPDHRVFHVHPFGASDVESERSTDGALLLPRYDDEGELYIGLRGVRAPQNVSLLLQMAEGSADPDLESERVRWSYLCGDRWLSLDDGNVLLDTTRGLINSGILELALPAAAPGTRLPGGLYWIRAAVARRSASVCDTVAIHAQAVSAVFVDRDNAPDHFSQPLPAGTIARLAAPLPEVAGVRQPYTSQGGRMAEAEAAFNTRVSERLRHKQRALSIWDYERLVLERFPEIYKVKCVPADLARHPDEPGRVEVVVIPDIRNKSPFNPFEPKAPADLLADVAEYLRAKTSATADPVVRNAHFVTVKVHVWVRFRSGVDVGYHRRRINEELNRFLSPWAYEEGADIVIGGRIYANSIIDFLDRRPYVDYVADIRLFRSDDGESFEAVTPTAGGEAYAVTINRPGGVLVAAREHEIDLIPEAGYEEELLDGIGFWRVQLDFAVGPVARKEAPAVARSG